MTTATACPHCGGPTANSNRHCKPEDSSTCDWLVYNGDKQRGQGIPPQEPGSNPRAGRWPANVVLDEAAAEVLDQMSGERKASGVYEGDGSRRESEPWATDFAGGHRPSSMFADAGGASRYFYTAKAGSDERITHNGTAHPTVKPLSLMRWLVRLVTPPGGLILEPFAGSGTTVEAALLEGFRCIAIEREADYLPLILERIRRASDPADAVAIRQATPWIDDDDLFSNLETA